MSTEVAEKVVAKPAEALLSKRRRKLMVDPLGRDNPITIQVLGICSSLAVTTKMEPTLVMGIGVTVVVLMSNLLISMLRNLIPNRIRIIVQLAIVATLVILVDQVLKAYMFDVSKKLSVFVGLIITNCIVMGRLEAFAMGNKPYDSVLDGFGNGLGYAMIILLISFVREIWGSASIFDFKLFAAMGWSDFPTNGLMTSPVGAFFILGFIIWIQRWRSGHTESH